jgi:hypothetical protein
VVRQQTRSCQTSCWGAHISRRICIYRVEHNVVIFGCSLLIKPHHHDDDILIVLLLGMTTRQDNTRSYLPTYLGSYGVRSKDWTACQVVFQRTLALFTLLTLIISRCEYIILFYDRSGLAMRPAHIHTTKVGCLPSWAVAETGRLNTKH